MVGSEDQLQNFLKGIFVQEESSGTRFDHGQFEIKTFPIYARPITYTYSSRKLASPWKLPLTIDCSETFHKNLTIKQETTYNNID